MRYFIAVILVLLHTILSMELASADECGTPAAKVNCEQADFMVKGDCFIQMSAGECTGSGSEDGGVGDTSGSPRVCKTVYGKTVPCETGAGTWSDVHSCWVKPASPQPPKSDPVWEGRSDGMIARCSVDGYV